MKKPAYLPIALVAVCAALLVASCAKPKSSYQWQNGSFSDQQLTATATTVTLSSANDSSKVIAFAWPLASFGFTASVTYTVQFDTPGDTATWAKAVSVVVGTNADSLSYLGTDFNALASALGMTPGTADTMVVRVEAAVLQNDGATSVIPPVYTNTVTILVTPYALDLYVPGAYQGWLPASAPTIAPFSTTYSYVFEGYVYFSPPGLNYFKYTNAPDWNHTNYGDGGNGTMSTNGLAAGLSVPDSGYYELTANLKDQTWTATKTVWGIIGDATPGGWSNDTWMTYNPATQVWTVTLNLSNAGSFKFRANGQWVIDFGVDNSGNLAYSDNPIVYNPNTNNLSVSTSGNYTVTLDLHVAGKYTYNLQMN